MSESTKTCSISGRIAQEDYEFLMQQRIPGKVTASEKLRHIASFYRKYHESMDDYADCLAELHRLLDPFHREMKSAEHATGRHSELLDRALTAVPELLAVLITSSIPAESSRELPCLLSLEERICDQALRFLESILRMGLTRESPTYNPHLLKDRLGTILELTHHLSQRGSDAPTPQEEAAQ